MSDFAGSYDHSLDGKGRVIIPAAFRDQLGENFTVGLSPDGNVIALYPYEEWEKSTQWMQRLHPMDKQGNAYKRLILGSAYTGNSMDLQGRVLLPAKLRIKFNLTKDIIFLGATDHLEIWDAALYNSEQEKAFDGREALLDYLHETYK
ncbi:MAG: division/cell wall cluster transcriptional repressor MraZ [Oscillospiraceae bacterium]|jgi:MraZ protein|nr:division/cell wall cluster transcriptional repressor MraZ [Oscillospiraceae bacterium]